MSEFRTKVQVSW